MTSKKTAPAPAQAGHNTGRPLDIIGADLRKLRNVFDSGELLAEAKKQCRQAKTKWLPWLETYFDGDDQTARNHMKAYDLSRKFQTIRDLKVPVSTIYKLTSFNNKQETEAVIKALAKATQDKKEPIRVREADGVIMYAQLRVEHGDYNDATLDALNVLAETDWSKKASAALKKANPDTEDAAAAIENAQHRKHLEKIFGALLPEFVDERPSLIFLDDVEEDDRPRVLARLQGAPGPFDSNQVWDIVHGQQDKDEGEGKDKQDEPPDTPDSMLPKPGDPSGADPAPAPDPEAVLAWVGGDDCTASNGNCTYLVAGDCSGHVYTAVVYIDSRENSRPLGDFKTIEEATAACERDAQTRAAATKETDQAAANAADEARKDIGAGSKSENARLTVVVEELQNTKRVLEIKVQGLESEIEELKAENKKLKAELTGAKAKAA
jgi:chaperonin cofactor prefoldin